MVIGAVILTIEVFAIAGMFQLFAKVISNPGHFSLTYSQPVEIVELSCIGCSQATIFGRYEAEGVSLDAAYVIAEVGTLKVAFESRTVVANERALSPGCHVRNLVTDDEVMVRARGLSLDFPSKNPSCGAQS